MDPFMGMISMFGFNFAPAGWALCNGQLMPISQNAALFSLLSTFYGGDGMTTFALPNLQSRVPMHFGSGPGLTPWPIGQASGSEAVTLSTSQMPMHTHPIAVTAGLYGETASANRPNPLSNMLATPPASSPIYAPPDADPSNNKLMASASLQVSATAAAIGGNQPFGILQPFLAVNFSIALQGLYPSRN